MPKAKLKFVLPVLLLVFGLGAWLHLRTENEAKVQMTLAREKCRQEDYAECVDLYQSLLQQYPKSHFADEALWEIGTIYYVNFDDIKQALVYFERLVHEYPDQPLAKKAYLRLAEIHEVDLQDLPQAVEYWKRALGTDSSGRFQAPVLFKIGAAYLKMSNFEEALDIFRRLIEERPDKHLAEQSLIRAGMILQIQGNHDAAIDSFHQVPKQTGCRDCRLQSLLELIESYEFVGDLPKAITVARAISATDYPEEAKRDLVGRLEGKKRYYQVRSWGNR